MDVTVATSSGKVRGREDGGVAAFLGVPYAAPPFGPGRMRAPRPAEPWSGVRDARSPGPSAPQPGYTPAMADLLAPAPPSGEDCLNLNVWTPAPGRTGGRLPVMVWIHGGAFRNGAGAVPTYDGTRLAADGVVCVTINYRLGPEGFLLLPDGTANLGLLDQIAALEWVQANIAAFGGDPANVTVFGESAGAISIAALMAMPRARGLFRRAIAQSGAGHHTHPEEIARRLTRRLAELAGVEPTSEALASAAPERLIAADTALRAEMARASDPGEWGESTGGGTSVLPVVDGATLPARPVDAIAAGAGRDVDLLTGTNSDEFRFFLVPTGMAPHVTEEAVAGLMAAYGLDPAAALEVYRAALPGATPGDLLAAVLTDHAYRIPAVRLAEARSAQGAATYVYEFTRATPVRDGLLGACHTAEIGFVFGTLTDPVLGEDAPAELSARMRAAWTSFARDGHPGAAGGVEWPAYGDERVVMLIGAQASAPAADPGGDRRRLFEGVR
ncbi:carboxylesterase/lipase family protein [Marinitenerispora sediminis]|uniref:Carboxylic ester hydrolase n=1 Tax=Marinitenerispora sediminis TaxID=1931232 RepID=A0A368T5D4_9ACTN|nr:carboxylesterase family protein [Marinitenerispora sediminis]RCV50694.1 carboxylesterase/lipase family protein [Marinitenerispora sediminis]RCV56369.1 carboxylesterase/lipase family protein [Marinitenerispora sediminis]RCV58704.1 carboxylesterase/lipase family protein [Marinitenerispora sediminis]